MAHRTSKSYSLSFIFQNARDGMRFRDERVLTGAFLPQENKPCASYKRDGKDGEDSSVRTHTEMKVDHFLSSSSAASLAVTTHS